MTDKLKDAVEMALKISDEIVNSNWRNWKEYASPNEFEWWAKSRANHMATILRQALANLDLPIDRGALDDIPNVTQWLDDLRGGDDLEEPQKQCEWTGLSDDEIGEILVQPNNSILIEERWTPLPFTFARAIEAKLKEKNTCLNNI